MTQKMQLLTYMQSGREITPREAIEIFSIYRTAARMRELREDGHPIVTRMVKMGRKGAYAAYSLHRPTQPDLFPVVNVVRRDGRVQQRSGDL